MAMPLHALSSLCLGVTLTLPTLHAQGAGSIRLRDPIFPQVAEQRGVVFGLGRRSIGPDQVLAMDVFTPVGDTATDRPVLICAFPGGFTSGSRNDFFTRALAFNFAARGYVTASIDYRLLRTPPATVDDVGIAIHEAVHDMRAAVRFFREDAANANAFGTDGRNIFVGGASAGAVLASFVGTFDAGDPVPPALASFLAANGGIAGNSSTNLEYSSSVAGVLSVSGAIADLAWIDPGSAPIYAAHEEFDPVVPCGTAVTGAAGGVPVTVSGACAMIPVAQSFDVPTEFLLVPGSFGHVSYSVAQFTQILDDSARFFYDEVIDHPGPRPGLFLGPSLAAPSMSQIAIRAAPGSAVALLISSNANPTVVPGISQLSLSAPFAAIGLPLDALGRSDSTFPTSTLPASPLFLQALQLEGASFRVSERASSSGTP